MGNTGSHASKGDSGPKGDLLVGAEENPAEELSGMSHLAARARYDELALKNPSAAALFYEESLTNFSIKLAQGALKTQPTQEMAVDAKASITALFQGYAARTRMMPQYDHLFEFFYMIGSVSPWLLAGIASDNPGTALDQFTEDVKKTAEARNNMLRIAPMTGNMTYAEVMPVDKDMSTRLMLVESMCDLVNRYASTAAASLIRAMAISTDPEQAVSQMAMAGDGNLNPDADAGSVDLRAFRRSLQVPRTQRVQSLERFREASHAFSQIAMGLSERGKQATGARIGGALNLGEVDEDGIPDGVSVLVELGVSEDLCDPSRSSETIFQLRDEMERDNPLAQNMLAKGGDQPTGPTEAQEAMNLDL